jgi:hypothetical protein
MKNRFLFSFLIAFAAFFQTESSWCQSSLQDSVYNLFIDFVNSKGEIKISEASKNFSNGLKTALVKDPRAEFVFDSLRKYKVMLESSDKQVRIFTWDVPANDFTHMYYGFVQAYNRKSKKYEVYELKDKSETIRDPENAMLDNTKWFGACYYSIIETKYKKKKYYTLLGWDGNNRNTNKKLVDVLTLNEKGFPKFGDAIFSDEKVKMKKRMIFEFKAGLVMSLRYDEDSQGIIFDHLSPSDPSLEGVYSFYGPDFSYDMLQFKEGKWQYIKNVDARNPKDKLDKHFTPPK